MAKGLDQAAGLKKRRNKCFCIIFVYNKAIRIKEPKGSTHGIFVGLNL